MTFKEKMAEVSHLSNLELTDVEISKFDLYKTMLLEWNENINLTAITEETEVAVKHFIDSLKVLECYKIEKGASVIDVGTGAGFPGIPMKIVRPDLKLTLLDSLNKRINFLRETGTAMEFEGAEYLHSRAEDAALDPRYREKFDVATARAVAGLSVLLEYCLPFVKIGGVFLAMKAKDTDDEIKDAQKALKELGGEILDVVKIQLPIFEGERTVVIVKKVKSTPKKYPRKAGTPSKKPL